MADAEAYMVLDARDAQRLSDLLAPFQEAVRPHVEGAKLASLAECVYLPMSVELCLSKAEKHKAHIDQIIAIKRQAMKVMEAFEPEFPRVHLDDRAAPSTAPQNAAATP